MSLEVALLNAAMPHKLDDARVPAHVLDAKKARPQQVKDQASRSTQVSNGGFLFTNFDGPNAGTNAGAGTNMNGISNSGTSVGFTIDNNGNFHNFTANPLKSRTTDGPEHQRIDDRHGLRGQLLRHRGGHRRQRQRVLPHHRAR